MSSIRSPIPKTLHLTIALDDGGPQFVVAMSVNCATSVMCIIGATVLRFYLARLNKILDQGVTIGHDGNLNEETRIRDIEDHGLPGAAVDRGFRFLL